jgi:lipoyl(octanoyl) transferase
MKPKVIFQSLGLIDYQKAWDFQEQLFKETIDLKIQIRNGQTTESTKNYLLFCEHPHVFTLGKSGDESHLLLNNEELSEHQAKFYKINRGGDITYHGPGQLVGYPIFDLDQFFPDIHKYMRFLEESVIQTLAEYGIESGRVWLDGDKPTARKICAMGVKSSRWVTMHGIGFNVNSDLSYFSHIVPCGIQDKAVTSLKMELGREIDMQEISAILKQKMADLFGYDYV